MRSYIKMFILVLSHLQQHQICLAGTASWIFLAVSLWWLLLCHRLHVLKYVHLSTRFPIFFPLRRPLCVPSGSPIEVHFWRCCGATKVSCSFEMGQPRPIKLKVPFPWCHSSLFCRYGTSGVWQLHRLLLCTTAMEGLIGLACDSWLFLQTEDMAIHFSFGFSAGLLCWTLALSHRQSRCIPLSY